MENSIIGLTPPPPPYWAKIMENSEKKTKTMTNISDLWCIVFKSYQRETIKYAGRGLQIDIQF